LFSLGYVGYLRTCYGYRLLPARWFPRWFWTLAPHDLVVGWLVAYVYTVLCSWFAVRFGCGLVYTLVGYTRSVHGSSLRYALVYVYRSFGFGSLVYYAHVRTPHRIWLHVCSLHTHGLPRTHMVWFAFFTVYYTHTVCHTHVCTHFTRFTVLTLVHGLVILLWVQTTHPLVWLQVPILVAFTVYPLHTLRLHGWFTRSPLHLPARFGSGFARGLRAFAFGLHVLLVSPHIGLYVCCGTTLVEVWLYIPTFVWFTFVPHVPFGRLRSVWLRLHTTFGRCRLRSLYLHVYVYVPVWLRLRYVFVRWLRLLAFVAVTFAVVACWFSYVEAPLVVSSYSSGWTVWVYTRTHAHTHRLPHRTWVGLRRYHGLRSGLPHARTPRILRLRSLRVAHAHALHTRLRTLPFTRTAYALPVGLHPQFTTVTYTLGFATHTPVYTQVTHFTPTFPRFGSTHVYHTLVGYVGCAHGSHITFTVGFGRLQDPTRLVGLHVTHSLTFRLVQVFWVGWFTHTQVPHAYTYHTTHILVRLQVTRCYTVTVVRYVGRCWLR